MNHDELDAQWTWVTEVGEIEFWESVRVFHPRPRAFNDEGFAGGYG
mgnify:FL=1